MPEGGGGRLLALREQFEAALPAGAASDAGAELRWQELRKLLECGDAFCLSRSVLTEEETREVLAKYDLDGSGGLSFSEFEPLAQDKLLLEDRLAEYRAAFEQLDSNGDGKLQPVELEALFAGLAARSSGSAEVTFSPAEVEALVEQYSVAGDGALDLAEFLTLARAKITDVRDLLEYVLLPGETSDGTDKGTSGGGGLLGGLKSMLGRRAAQAALPDFGEVEVIDSEEGLDAILAETPGLVVLECAFTWCRPCMGFDPKYKRFAGYYTKVRFLKVFGNENSSTKHLVKERLGVKASPNFYFFRAGELVAEKRGANEDKFRTALLAQMLPEEKP